MRYQCGDVKGYQLLPNELSFGCRYDGERELA
jgi:hypothetical protein